MTRVALSLLVLAACIRSLPPVTPVPPADADRAVIALTAEAWVQHGLPRPDGIEDVLVTDAADLDTFHRLCAVCGPSAVDPDCTIRYHGALYRGHACVTGYDRGIFQSRSSLIVLAPEQRTLDQREAIIVYESVRWCGTLSNLGARPHEGDPAVWCIGTCTSESVEGRAREAVRRARGGR